MKAIKLSCFSLLVGAVLGSANGQPFRTNVNPALIYYQAFLVAPDPMPEADSDYLYSKEGLSQKLPERFGKLAAAYDNQFRLVRQAAQAGVPCDWGIDFSAGPATLLPHLARAKGIAIAARLRVMWELQHDRQADARDDLLASFALGRNVSRDGTLISALVQVAVEAIDCNIIAENFGQFSPETLSQLADGLEALPARGTMAACMTTEKASFHDWLLAKVLEAQKANPGDDVKAMAVIRDLLANTEGRDEGQADESSPSIWERVNKASGGTSDGVLRLLRDREQIYQKLAVILALPQSEYKEQAKRFTAELENTSNPLISLVAPAFGRCREKESRALVNLALVRAAVEYKLHGEPGLQSVSDPRGEGPFAFRRFIFEGVDRGFELKSANDAGGFQQALIFVETEGAPFRVNGPHAGEALPSSAARK